MKKTNKKIQFHLQVKFAGRWSDQGPDAAKTLVEARLLYNTRRESSWWHRCFEGCPWRVIKRTVTEEELFRSEFNGLTYETTEQSQ